jgi:hypothetical protein
LKRILSVVAVAGSLVTVGPARASLTTSEVEQIRGYVATDAHADRVRSLVARPDLTADESATAMTTALGGVTIDAPRLTYLDEVVRGAPTAATRPVLAVATVRGLLARADTIYSQHPADLGRAAPALAEVGLAYGWVAGEASGVDSSITDAARADIGKAIADHIGRNASILRLDSSVPVPVARLRAQLAIALLDAMPDGVTRRVDAADKLALTGARRAALVETGLLVLDATGSDDRVPSVRALLDRLPGAREGVEAIFVGDEHAQFRSRGTVACAGDATGGLGEAASPWGPEADAPSIPAAAMALARGLGAVAVHRALDRRPQLRVQVDQDGGEPGVATLAAMLALDAPRTLDVAAARLIAGRPESAAWLGDALGALAVFAPAGDAKDGLVVPVEHGPATHVVLEPTGSANAFRLGAHLWRIDRGPAGAVGSLKRDGAPVALSMLQNAHVAPTDGSSWTGAGMVFARLTGGPRVAISAGPRVRVVGSGYADAVSTPSPSDDLTLDADLRVDGAPAGIAVRALPAGRGFEGASILVVPGSPAHVAFVVGEGSGAETAAAPVVEAPAGPSVHLHLTLAGKTLLVTVGQATTTVALPDALAHGDLALRAYAGGILDVSGWKVASPRHR